jgi:hypothetical protein
MENLPYISAQAAEAPFSANGTGGFPSYWNRFAIGPMSAEWRSRMIFLF